MITVESKDQKTRMPDTRSFYVMAADDVSTNYGDKERDLIQGKGELEQALGVAIDSIRVCCLSVDVGFSVPFGSVILSISC